MARITVEDCLEIENNRFALVLLATRRAKQILSGAPVVLGTPCDNKAIVISLREIAARLVGWKSAAEISEEKATREAALAAARAQAEATVAEAAPAL